MRWLRGFVTEERGSLSVEWVAVTAALILVAGLVTHSLFAGGVNAIGEENATDFNRVQVGE